MGSEVGPAWKNRAVDGAVVVSSYGEWRERAWRRAQLGARLRCGAHAAPGEFWWDSYVGLGLVISLVLVVLAGGLVITPSGSPASVLEEARLAGRSFLAAGLGLALAFTPSFFVRRRGRLLLTAVALPLCLAVAAAAGLLLAGLAGRPAATELRRGRHLLGSFPCRDRGCRAAPPEQAAWWTRYLERPASTLEAAIVAAELVDGLDGLDIVQRAETADSLLRLVQREPARQQALHAALQRAALRQDEVGGSSGKG